MWEPGCTPPRCGREPAFRARSRRSASSGWTPCGIGGAAGGYIAERTIRCRLWWNDRSAVRAIVYSETGGPDVLRLVERPVREPPPGEVRVRVRVSGVNPTDWKARRGRGGRP